MFKTGQQIPSVERNANPEAAAASGPAWSAGSSVWASLQARWDLGGGLVANLATRSTLSVVDGAAQILLQANAWAGSIQIDPEGLLAYSDGHTITRWNPATGRSHSFAYSFPDRYGSEEFEGMLALPEGRTLVIGTVGMVGPHLLSVHEPDGTPCLQIDLAGDGQAIDEVFASVDRQRIYLSCHHWLGQNTGHGVHRLDLTKDLTLERLTFHPTEAPFTFAALVTENEDIVLLQNSQVRRCSSSRGTLLKSSETLGAVQRELGDPARLLPKVPLGPRF